MRKHELELVDYERFSLPGALAASRADSEVRSAIGGWSQSEHSRERRQEGPRESASSQSHPQHTSQGCKCQQRRSRRQVQLDAPTAHSFTRARQLVTSRASRTNAQEVATKTSAPWHVCARTAWAVTALKLAQPTADSDAKNLEILRSARSLLPL